MPKRLVAMLAALLAAGAAAVTVEAGSAGASPVAVPAPGGSFVALTPARILDTRSGLGGPRGATQQVTVNTAGVAGIPADGVSAVAVNLTVTGPTASGYLTAYAAGAVRPFASNANYAAGQTVATTTLIPVNGTGQFTIYASSRTQLVADATGYFTTVAAATPTGLFHPLPAARLMDTRSRLGGTAPGPRALTTLQVTGAGGVPDSGVSAVVINTTVPTASATTYVTAYPAGIAPPATSTINVTRGETRANRAIIPVGQDGRISFYNAAGTTQLVVDVAGYFSRSADSTGSYYVAQPPARLLDSRNSTAGWSEAAHSTNPLGVTIDAPPNEGSWGRAQSMANVAQTTAVWLTLTGIDPARSGYVTAFPSRTDRPATSDLNSIAAQVTSNAAVVQAGADGTVTVYSSVAENFVADIDGYFATPAPIPTRAGVWAWGGGLLPNRSNSWLSDNGVYSINSATDIKTIISDGTHFDYALRSDGSIVEWNSPRLHSAHLDRSTGLVQFGPTVRHDYVQLAGSQIRDGSTIYARRSDGTVWAWGRDDLGQFGDGSRRDTTTIDYGFDPPSISPQLGQVQLSDVTLIGGALATGYAMKSDGTVWSWGFGHFGQLGNGATTDSYLPVQVSGLQHIRSIAGGTESAYAVDSSGHLWRWGTTERSDRHFVTVTAPTMLPGGCADGASVFANEFGSWELCTDGTVWQLDGTGPEPGDETSVIGPVPTLTHITALSGADRGSAGNNTGLQALDDQGRVWRYDETAQAYQPVPELIGITAIGGGGQPSYAVAGG